MKAAIITITEGQNYGNRLQNYALQEVIGSFGIDVDTLSYEINSKYAYSKSVLKDIIKHILRRNNTNFHRRERIKKFNQFNQEYIKFQYINKLNIDWEKLSQNYDYFVFGSDQIWNTRFQLIRENIDFFLGSNIQNHHKISYAASFGTDDIEVEFKVKIQEELSKFQALSVREKEGKKIIGDLLGKNDSCVVLDPTLLLTKEKWASISKKPNGFEYGEDYLLSYFLGGKTEKENEYLKFMSKKYNAKVVDIEIEFKTDNEVLNKKIFSYNPAEFIWVLIHSRIVITDSYHATVFSLLFNKKFVVFPRISTESDNDTNSRMITLLNAFGKMNHYMGEKTDLPYIIEDSNVSEDVLEKYRNESLEFLSKNLVEDKKVR